jgi:hypothetical protein
LPAGKPIVLRYPAYLQQIAFGVAVGSAGIGVWSIYHYSTTHVALSLMMMSVFWTMAGNFRRVLLRLRLMDQSIGDVNESRQAEILARRQAR